MYETMEGLFEADFVEKKTMGEFDEACLTPLALSSSESLPSADWKSARIIDPSGGIVRLL